MDKQLDLDFSGVATTGIESFFPDNNIGSYAHGAAVGGYVQTIPTTIAPSGIITPQFEPYQYWTPGVSIGYDPKDTTINELNKDLLAAADKITALENIVKGLLDLIGGTIKKD